MPVVGGSVERTTVSASRVVDVTGELDLSTVAHWEAEVEQAAERACTVVLDLTGLAFIDSAGVHSLFRMLAALDRRAKRLVVVAPPDGAVRRLLDVLNLTALADVYDSRADALRVAHG